MKTINSKVIGENKWTKVLQDTIEYSSVTTADYILVERNPGVIILPIHIENDQIFTYLVRQFRYPINQSIWQFPAGGVEGTDVIEAAKEELTQETGLLFKDFTLIKELFVDPGFSRQKCSYVVAENYIEQRKQQLEASEGDLIMKKVSLIELNAMMDQGEMNDNWGYICRSLLRDYILIHYPSLA